MYPVNKYIVVREIVDDICKYGCLNDRCQNAPEEPQFTLPVEDEEIIEEDEEIIDDIATPDEPDSLTPPSDEDPWYKNVWNWFTGLFSRG